MSTAGHRCLAAHRKYIRPRTYGAAGQSFVLGARAQGLLSIQLQSNLCIRAGQPFGRLIDRCRMQRTVHVYDSPLGRSGCPPASRAAELAGGTSPPKATNGFRTPGRPIPVSSAEKGEKHRKGTDRLNTHETTWSWLHAWHHQHSIYKCCIPLRSRSTRVHRRGQVTGAFLHMAKRSYKHRRTIAPFF